MKNIKKQVRKGFCLIPMLIVLGIVSLGGATIVGVSSTKSTTVVKKVVSPEYEINKCVIFRDGKVYNTKCRSRVR